MKSINVYPNFLTEHEGFKLWSHANEAQYVRNWKADVYSHKSNGRFVHHINPESFLIEYADFWKRLEETSECKLELLDPYINCSNAHTVTLTHYDTYNDNHFTIIAYLNQEWHKDWAGYTAFFEEMDKNKIIAIEVPEYKKIVMFDGRIPHYALPSTITAPDRFTLAIKVRKLND